jgi:hypothetical protein
VQATYPCRSARMLGAVFRKNLSVLVKISLKSAH